MGKPLLSLKTIFTSPPEPVAPIVSPPFVPAASGVIDLRTATLYDGTDSVLLSQVFAITPNANAAIKTDVYYTDGTVIAEFGYKYDLEVGKYAAGLAFLEGSA